MFFISPFAKSSKLIIFVLFYYIVPFNLFYIPEICLFHTHMHVSTESIDCILLSSFELKAMLLISSVNTLCFLLLNLCCVFNISLLFFMNCLLFSQKLFTLIDFFLHGLFRFQAELFLKSVYNLQI